MPRRCEVVKMPDGGTAFVTYSTPNRKCRSCGGHRATLACDYPTPKGTCDKPICRTCAVHVGPNEDWCPGHPRAQHGDLFKR